MSTPGNVIGQAIFFNQREMLHSATSIDSRTEKKYDIYKLFCIG